MRFADRSFGEKQYRRKNSEFIIFFLYDRYRIISLRFLKEIFVKKDDVPVACFYSVIASKYSVLELTSSFLKLILEFDPR